MKECKKEQKILRMRKTKIPVSSAGWRTREQCQQPNALKMNSKHFMMHNQKNKLESIKGNMKVEKKQKKEQASCLCISDEYK